MRWGIDDGGEMNIILFAETENTRSSTVHQQESAEQVHRGHERTTTSNLIEPAWVWFESL